MAAKAGPTRVMTPTPTGTHHGAPSCSPLLGERRVRSSRPHTGEEDDCGASEEPALAAGEDALGVGVGELGVVEGDDGRGDGVGDVVVGRTVAMVLGRLSVLSWFLPGFGPVLCFGAVGLGRL